MRGNYRLTTQSARNVNNNLHVLAITMGPEEELSSTCLCVCVSVHVYYMIGRWRRYEDTSEQRKSETEQRFTSERGNKTPTKTKLVYLKYTHTNNCAHIDIGRVSISN